MILVSLYNQDCGSSIFFFFREGFVNFINENGGGCVLSVCSGVGLVYRSLGQDFLSIFKF